MGQLIIMIVFMVCIERTIRWLIDRDDGEYFKDGRFCNKYQRCCWYLGLDDSMKWRINFAHIILQIDKTKTKKKAKSKVIIGQ